VRMDGVTSDVLRRQADGRWLFVIDNPWGAGVLG
jgi:ketosteroid isomerase-like protein